MRLHAIGIEAPPPRFVLLDSEEEADMVSARLELMTGKGGFTSQDVSAFLPCLSAPEMGRRCAHGLVGGGA